MEKEVGEQPTDIWTYGRAIFSEAWMYFAYGGGAALLGFWGYSTRRSPPLWIFFAVLMTGFFVGGFRTWQRERVDRNAQVAGVARLKREVGDLSPRFVPEITEVFVEGDHEQRDWIKIYVTIVIRNQGAPSAIDSWRLKVVPPQPANYFIETEKGLLSGSPKGLGDKIGGNLLHDREIVERGGVKEGWLLCHGPKNRVGLTTSQTPAVQVSFKDSYGTKYTAVYPPQFKMEVYPG